MCFRLIVFALIPAIVACPTWCASGLCPTALCCAETPRCTEAPCCAEADARACGETASEHLADCDVADCDEAAACCQRHRPQPDSDAPAHPQPAPEKPCPSNSSCDCFCGGAVLDKPVELGEGMFPPCLPVPAYETATATRTGESRHGGHFAPLPRHGNLGRFLRALHMSFLC